MIDYYTEIRMAHIACVCASGLLFFIRGLAVQLGATWPMVAPLRFTSYFIDTGLLTAAVLLCVTLAQYPFVNSWLTLKVLLLLAYILAGSFALKRGRTRRQRLVCWLVALLLFLAMVAVATTRFPQLTP